MPFIHTQVNRPISTEQEKRLAREMGGAIGLLEKSEDWLMLRFDDCCRLYFKGDSQKPLAFVNVKLYGRAGEEQCRQFTGKITQILSDTLAIAPDGIYVEYDETEKWGWKGENF